MATKKFVTDVLVAGGGTSGVCASIQAARLGVSVVLVEETAWLGGMLTAAGVSATDGNHRLPSGLWGEFRQRLYDYYGGPDALKTGWVSDTQFEPHVGNAIFHQMVQQESQITLMHDYWLVKAIKEKNQLAGAEFTNANGDRLTVLASVCIDATEYGDLMALAGCEYSLGRDSRDETGEPQAPQKADTIIQDLTFVAILKNYGEGNDQTLSPPPDYNPHHYFGCCHEATGKAQSDLVDCQTMLNYGRLPNQKYMLNWPIQGNDFYLNIIEKNRAERLQALQTAKNFTLGWIYFLQTELDLHHYGLADDEFPTSNRFPFIPYIRESRRLKGVVRLTTNELIQPFQSLLYQFGIAVGDYPLDHHHQKSPTPVEESFPPIPAFNVPYGCLVPAKIDGLLVAEKSISVTHLVNGCTRLQPVVMQIGQAAGAAAAICIQQRLQPREIDVRQLQQRLLNANCWLMPFGDITPTDWAFQAVQRTGLSGLFKGELISKGWANEMRFHPDSGLNGKETIEMVKKVTGGSEWQFSGDLSSGKLVTRIKGMHLLWQLIGAPEPASLQAYFRDVSESHLAFKAMQFFHERDWLKNFIQENNLQPEKVMTRKEWAVLVDQLFKPFERELKLI